jgi:DNA gyrase subunit B
MTSKFKQIEPYMEPPFVIEVAGKSAPAAGNGADEELSDAEREDLEKTARKTTKVAPKMKAKEAEVVEKTNPRDLFEYVLGEGKKDFSVQRYKGLGEMTAEQLWETTMDPERRTLLSVKLEDIAETENIFTTLMGENVEARRKFIEDNALDVKNLDI